MKRIVIFKGGLGNQISQYGMYSFKKNIEHRDVRYFYREADHNGFELDKYFNVGLRKASCWYEWLYWVVWRLNKYGICRRFIFFERGKAEQKCDIFINGYWTDRRYFLHSGFDISFKDLPLSERNQRIATLMTSGDSVAVHVRRGDYLLPQNRAIFNTLGTDYYLPAIDYCRQHLHEPRFFFFSDDIAWVKEHLKVENAEYIDWNTGNDSVYDMYLMSLATANIIANSTFSFWATILNKRKQIAIYPDAWYSNGAKKRDMFPDDWIMM